MEHRVCYHAELLKNDRIIRMHPLLNTAVSAARKAGKIIIRAMNTGETLEITEKRHNDFVTQIDPACEAAIVNTIHTAYPDHNFLCEESGEIKHSDGPYCWVIDPLDGTTNFIHRLPYIAISIALQKNGKTVLGLVYNPITQDLFTAELGNGAMLNDRRIRVSNTS
ncbi:MAG: inositol monophosphatase, partial [Gammaproteobacteria bacterium]|nr:inositol monophosphatase [Gammaproteobacteria bacterium]